MRAGGEEVLQVEFQHYVLAGVRTRVVHHGPLARVVTGRLVRRDAIEQIAEESPLQGHQVRADAVRLRGHAIAACQMRSRDSVLDRRAPVACHQRPIASSAVWRRSR
jgi:hypothetical protein